MISGKILRDAIISGANNINNQRSRVDELNVFPVPDGDTGTNMGMTIGAAVPELEALADDCTVGEAAKTAASAMLRGARGQLGRHHQPAVPRLLQGAGGQKGGRRRGPGRRPGKGRRGRL